LKGIAVQALKIVFIAFAAPLPFSVAGTPRDFSRLTIPAGEQIIRARQTLTGQLGHKRVVIAVRKIDKVYRLVSTALLFDFYTKLFARFAAMSKYDTFISHILRSPATLRRLN
jgi:hypothetical protein